MIIHNQEKVKKTQYSIMRNKENITDYNEDNILNFLKIKYNERKQNPRPSITKFRKSNQNNYNIIRKQNNFVKDSIKSIRKNETIEKKYDIGNRKN